MFSVHLLKVIKQGQAKYLLFCLCFGMGSRAFFGSWTLQVRWKRAMSAQQLSKITASSIANHFCQKRSQASIYNHQEDAILGTTKNQCPKPPQPQEFCSTWQKQVNMCLLILTKLLQGSALSYVDLKPHTYNQRLMLAFTFYPACLLPQNVHDNAGQKILQI